MFGIQEHLIREVSGLKERSLGEEMDPVRSWVRNVGVVDANVAAQRYSKHPAVLLTFTQHFFISCSHSGLLLLNRIIKHHELSIVLF